MFWSSDRSDIKSNVADFAGTLIFSVKLAGRGGLGNKRWNLKRSREKKSRLTTQKHKRAKKKTITNKNLGH